MVPTLPEPPPTLVDALRSGRAVAVVGAGLSRASGAPDRNDLIAALADEAVRLRPRDSVRVSEARALLEKSAYLDSASVLKDVLGTEFARSVTRIINGVREPSLSHQILMQLPFRAIVTTSYDRLLELAPVPGHSPPSWYWSDLDLPTRVRESSRFILKLHGDVQRPETIVLAREDYSRCLNDERTREALRTLLGANVPFYVGYGHRDPDLDTLLDAQRERSGLDGGFALIAGEDSARDTRLRNARIFGVQLETQDDVPSFLLSLAAAIGIRLRLCLTLVTDVDWTTPEAAEQLGRRVALTVASHLGCDAAVREVRPGSIIVVIELPGPAAVDALLRIQRRDSDFAGLLLECRVTSIGGLKLKGEPTTVGPAPGPRTPNTEVGAAKMAASDAVAGSHGPEPESHEGGRRRPSATVTKIAAVVAAIGGVGGVAALLNWIRPPTPMCIAGEVRDCTSLVPCQTKGAQVCVSTGRSWSACNCPSPTRDCHLRFVEPVSETVVDDRMLVRVTGEGQCDLKSVWIVVHPIKGDEFWVQPKPTQRGNEWTAYVRVGRSDSDWTEVFELRAFGNPVGGLGAGKLVTDWPKAAVESDPITVKRKPFPVSMPVPGPSSENSGGRREARCPEPFEIGAVRMPGANRAQVTLSPAIPGFEYEVHITAPNGQSYVERLSGGVGVVRLGDAANTGTFILQGSARGIGTCTTQYSKPVSITLE